MAETGFFLWGLFWGHTGILEKKMEATIVLRGLYIYIECKILLDGAGHCRGKSLLTRLQRLQRWARLQDRLNFEKSYSLQIV